MFFSRVRIEPTNISQLNLLKIFQGNIYATHQLIWKLFPDKSQDKRDFLLDRKLKKNKFLILKPVKVCLYFMWFLQANLFQ